MRNTIFFVFIVLITNFTVQAQNCNHTNHSTNIMDSWLSCEKTKNPNASRGDSHWVQYDLGYVYNISSFKLWNYNVAGETGKGMKNVAIDYSLDGVNWTSLTAFELAEASGSVSYEGEDAPEFAQAEARYVLISSLDTWSVGACAGLSELRMDVYKLTNVTNVDVLADDVSIQLFPNPTKGQFRIQGDLENYEIGIMDVGGQLVQTLSTNGGEVEVDVSSLPNGLYFVSMMHRENGELVLQRVVKF